MVKKLTGLATALMLLFGVSVLAPSAAQAADNQGTSGYVTVNIGGVVYRYNAAVNWDDTTGQYGYVDYITVTASQSNGFSKLAQIEYVSEGSTFQHLYTFGPTGSGPIRKDPDFQAFTVYVKFWVNSTQYVQVVMNKPPA